MRIEQLRYLEAVVEFGSIRKASEALHISQPALSTAIRSLEQELGVTLLVRHRDGARISAEGSELLPHVTEILGDVAQLQGAAAKQHRFTAIVRIGTVHAATAPVLAPALAEFRRTQPQAKIEVVTVRQAEIETALRDGTLDVGLVNVLAGDDLPGDLHHVALLHGTPVVCCATDSPLAASDVITREQLNASTFIAMRSGYVMSRYVHRVFGVDAPEPAFLADGAEPAKLMVAQGLGVTVLPDFSVLGDPLETSGAITTRPLADATDTVTLVLERRRVTHVPTAVAALEAALREQADVRRRAAG